MRRSLGKLLVIAVLIAGAALPAGTATAADTDPTDHWQQRRVLNVAHAGGDLEAPHSTLYAMKTAVAAGTDVLELDLRLSADGVLMAHHDATVDRTTEATGPVRDFTAAELHELDNAHWFVPDCWSCKGRPDDAYELRGIRTGERPPPTGFGPDDFTIPTLAEVAAAFPHRLLDVEIKDGPDGVATAEALAAFITDNGPVDRWLVASFDDDLLDHFKALAPDVATSPGLGVMTEWFATRGPLPDHEVLQVPPDFSGIEVVTQQFVDDAHAADLAVWVWFNGTDDDSPDTWQHLIDIGVDALLTGKPAAAEEVIDTNDVRFAVAPEVDAAATVRRRAITAEVSCPLLHVDTCRGRVVVATADRRGRVVTVGTEDIEIPRGRTDRVAVRIERDARRLVRRGGEAALAIVPADGDTGGVLMPLTLHRR